MASSNLNLLPLSLQLLNQTDLQIYKENKTYIDLLPIKVYTRHLGRQQSI